MNKHLPTRRDFLSGKAALASAADLITTKIEELLPNHQQTTRKRAKPLMVISRRAMACQFEVRLESEAGADSVDAAIRALDKIEAVEDRLTIYREKSDLIEINKIASKGTASIPNDLVELFELAGQLWSESSGAFDVTSGPLSRLWGFDRRDPVLPDQVDIESYLASVGWKQVEFDPAKKTIEFLNSAIEINFNSLGKGYALDKACEVLTESEINSFLIQGGRSSLIARGKNPLSNSEGWPIGIRNPYDPKELLTQINLKDESLSSSGNATQGFWHNERRLGHLIDPRTGWPTEGVLMATAIVSGSSPLSAAKADALSTAFYIMGQEATKSYCQSHPEVRAIFLTEDRSHPGSVWLASFD